MAGICSVHGTDIPVEGCAPCHATMRDFIPEWDRIKAEVEAAGTWTCQGCGFVQYRTVTSCLSCGRAEHNEV